MKVNFLEWCKIPFWLAKGKANLKAELDKRLDLDIEKLPYRQDVIAYLKEEKNSGAKLVLVTATIQHVAEKIAAHLNIFDEVHGSNRSNNLLGSKKLELMNQLYGKKNFIYVGDSNKDEIIFENSAGAITVGISPGKVEKIASTSNVIRSFFVSGSKFQNFIKQIRVYQWVKNLLIFIPLLLAHKADPAKFLIGIAAFFAFSFASSSIYILNDLLDLEADRKHPRKKYRPIASGNFKIKTAFLISPVLFIAGLTLGWFISYKFFFVLLFYVVLTNSYSFSLKKIYITDIIVLSILYTLRIISGAEAMDVNVSPWLLAFSIFLFLSLATVKRYTELLTMKSQNREKASGRGYYVADIELIRTIGPSAGMMSILVLALYVSSPEVKMLYHNPDMLYLTCPFFLFWVLRIWFKAHRGEMHDDPIIFTAKDKFSWLIGAIMLLITIGATL